MSNEDTGNGSSARKRKGHKPCDMCRRKKLQVTAKSHVDTVYNMNSAVNTRTERQYAISPTVQRAAPTSSSYVHSLETRLKAVESLLRESNAGPSHPAQTSPPHQDPNAHNDANMVLIIRAIRKLNTPFLEPHQDDLTFVEIAGSLHSLSLNNPGDHGYQGKSSLAMAVKAAVDLKNGDSIPASNRQIPFPTVRKIKPWEVTPPRPSYTFPDDDLMVSLIALYFDSLNVFLPLLHRPTFETAIATNTHLRDDGFAGTLLLVCALGARYSDDPRIHLPKFTSCGTAGWKWFDQVKLAGNPLLGQPSLYDLQCYCLAVQFLERTSGARACWTLVGFGIRMGQDIGAHRMKTRTRVLTPEEELEKRAYWLLILFDTQFSGALGRSIGIQAHDFDLLLPIRCDDEYWEAGPHGPAFSQPTGKPSLVDFFACQLNLNRILAFTLKILYSTNHGRAFIGLQDGWEEQVVMELDSALNVWFDSVPPHLRWDPACPNDIFFDQSAALYCSYYLVQILIHRPFIPAVRRSFNHFDSLTSFPSLSICNNAARACSHVAEIQQRRRPRNPLVFAQTALFTSGIVLLLNIWGGTRVGQKEDANLSDVHRCTGVLRAHKETWPSAGHLLDTLEQLLKIHHAPPARPLSAVYDPSPFVTASGAYPSAADLHNREAWERIIGRDMLDHTGGPGEAPARVPRLQEPAADGPSATASFADAAAFSVPQTFDTTQNFGPSAFGVNGNTDMNMDTVAIWSAAPSAFEVSDWDFYLSNLAGTMNGDESGAM
ncbi:fungal-specific transcription factor domain-containing protein [Mycena rosella]|uniref:Fungal-specific transcription factor domain-containing protein n=1 Tax=Mycena rosella TaxID=1033263 RepID=A0AAD7DU42_MYCRO|nr:fungal-specific transcription factor domain-containing protein [Mycena rosella]